MYLEMKNINNIYIMDHQLSREIIIIINISRKIIQKSDTYTQHSHIN